VAPRRPGLHRPEALDPKPDITRGPREVIPIDGEKLRRFDGIGHHVTSDREGQSGMRGAGRAFTPIASEDASRFPGTAMMPNEGRKHLGNESREPAAFTSVRAACTPARSDQTDPV
jgi:hypothetical protein